VTSELLTEATPETYAAVHRVITAVVALGGAVGWLHVPDERETAEFLDAQLALARAVVFYFCDYFHIIYFIFKGFY
jgi:hypothetical protein